ncbi:MAG: CerR family C-terminal domain-containing protein [Planctomycetota bacterium]
MDRFKGVFLNTRVASLWAIPMDSDNAELKGRLLDAALQLFAERGQDRVSLRDIATEAGATHGSIRHHFGTKENLYLEAVMQIEPMDLPGRDWSDLESISPEEGADRLRVMVKDFVSYQVRIGADRSAALGLLRAEVLRDGGPDPVFYKRVIHPGHEKLKRIMKAIRPDIEDEQVLEILAFNVIFQCVMVRIGRGIILKRLRKRTLTRKDADRIAHLISELTLAGLQEIDL